MVRRIPFYFLKRGRFSLCFSNEKDCKRVQEDADEEERCRNERLIKSFKQFVRSAKSLRGPSFRSCPDNSSGLCNHVRKCERNSFSPQVEILGSGSSRYQNQSIMGTKSTFLPHRQVLCRCMAGHAKNVAAERAEKGSNWWRRKFWILHTGKGCFEKKPKWKMSIEPGEISRELEKGFSSSLPSSGPTLLPKRWIDEICFSLSSNFLSPRFNFSFGICLDSENSMQLQCGV